MSSSHRISKLSQRTALLPVISGVVLLALNLLLVKQNMELKAYARSGEGNQSLKPGTVLPPIEGHDMNGNKLQLDYGDRKRKTLLMVFSPGCGACRENMPNWQAIIRGLDKQSYRLVGVSLAAKGTQEYVEKNQMQSVTIMAEIDPKVRVAYKLQLSPQLILIDADGAAERVWSGVLDSNEKREVESLLNLTMEPARTR